MDDAVPLDDEFALQLERRSTNNLSKNRSTSRLSIKSASSRGSRRRRFSATPDFSSEDIPSIADLKAEEEQIAFEEEEAVEQSRSAAQRLALERGLSSQSLGSLAETNDEQDASKDPPESTHDPPEIIQTIERSPHPEVSSELIEVSTPNSHLNQSSSPEEPLDKSRPSAFNPAALPRFV